LDEINGRLNTAEENIRRNQKTGHILYRGTKKGMTAGLETMGARKALNLCSTERKSTCQPRPLHPAKMSSKTKLK